MRDLWKRTTGILKAIHQGEEGATMVEYVLIIMAVALPLLALVLYYGGEIKAWVGKSWGEVTSKQDLGTP